MNRAYPLLLAAGAALLLSACETTDEGPGARGALRGYAPKWQVAGVTATDAANRAFRTAAFDSGRYVIGSLPPGNYTVTFQPTACYAAPAPQMLTVLPGDTTTVAEPMLPSKNGHFDCQRVLTWQGRDYVSDYSAGCLQASAQAGELTIKVADRYRENGDFSVELQLQGFAHAPGTFALGPNAASQLAYGGWAGSQPLWSTAASGGSGVVTITAVGTNPRRISGTFSALVQPVAANAQYQVRFRNGTFTDVLY